MSYFRKKIAMHLKVMAGIMVLLATMVGEEALLNRAQCAIISKRSWKGILLERVCCDGTLYLAQNGKITAHDGDCPPSAKREIRCANRMTLWAIMLVQLWLRLTVV